MTEDLNQADQVPESTDENRTRTGTSDAAPAPRGDGSTSRPLARLSEEVGTNPPCEVTANLGATAGQETASRTLPPDLAGVPGLVNLLVKLVKMIALYPPTRAIPVRILQDLSRSLSAVFQETEVVRLVVGRGKLSCAGEQVLVEADEADSMSGRLFRDGVREFSFHRGVTTEEVLKFLGLFRLRDTLRKVDTDDLVTLLWESEFRLITFVALDDLNGLSTEVDSIPEEFQVDLTASADAAIYDFEDESMVVDGSSVAEMYRSRLQGGDVGLFRVTGDERAALLREWETEESEEQRSKQFCRVLRELLLSEASDEDFAIMLETVGDKMRECMEVGHLAELARLLDALRSLVRDKRDLSPAMRDAVEVRICKAWDSTAQVAYIDHLDGGNPLALGGLAELCDALPAEAVKFFCEILGELQTARARKRMIQALSDHGDGQVEQFIAFLKDERWYLVRNVALILGAIGNPDAVEFLSKTVYHSDFRVRKEALGALERLDPEGTRALLDRGIHDPDPRMRVLAVRSLSAHGYAAMELIASAMADRKFSRRDPAEIRSFCEAYAYAGRELAVPRLAAIANQKNLLRSRQTDEIRAAACRSLGWTGATEATAILRGFLDDRSALVRKAARAGLSHLGATTIDPSQEEEAA